MLPVFKLFSQECHVLKKTAPGIPIDTHCAVYELSIFLCKPTSRLGKKHLTNIVLNLFVMEECDGST